LKKSFVIAAAAVAFAVVILAIVWRAPASPKEPLYEGKTLEYWLGEVFTTNQPKAFSIFHSMNPETAPALVKVFKSSDTHWRKFYLENYPKLPAVLRSHLRAPVPSETLWNAAAYVLNNNPTVTRAALPDLIQLLSDKDNRARIYILAGIQTEFARTRPEDTQFVPVLIQCLADTNAFVHQDGAICLQFLGPVAKGAVPALTASLKDNDPAVRLDAADALWRIDRQTNTAANCFKELLATTTNLSGPIPVKHLAAMYVAQVEPSDLSGIPILIDALQHSYSGLKISAASTLATFGPAASNAIPALIEAVESGDPALRQAAVDSLIKIDPKTAAKYELP
jgi:HEAT repeat protein